MILGGRLIDADAFIEKQTEQICENCDRRRGGFRIIGRDQPIGARNERTTRKSRWRTLEVDGMLMKLTAEEAYALIAFIKMHEREDIPDDVWDICMKLYDFVEDAQ